ncbi:MAG: hypothetical protein V5B32_10590 [Candidatus Accumulibacter sp. UW26]|jgi:hypothetical protein
MDPFASPRGEIHLGELIRALDSLPWENHAQAQAIAGCLGFGIPTADPGSSDRPTRTVHDRSAPSTRSPADTPGIKPPPGFATPRPGASQVELPARVLAAQLHPLPTAPMLDPAGAPEWITGDYQRLDPTPGIAPRRQALFPDRTVRGVFTAALSTLRAGNVIDVDALLGHLIQGRIPTEIPRLPSPTLGRGCQLLLDFSDSMLPWWEDLRQLAQQVSAILGNERVSVFDFDATPATAVQWQAGKENETPWQPQSGRPILVATDLRIRGRPADHRAGAKWQDFGKICTEQHCPLLILVPWSREYWPTDLGPNAELLHWHPQTSAAMLRQQLAYPKQR